MKNIRVLLIITEITISIIQIACFIIAYRNAYDFSLFITIELLSMMFLIKSMQEIKQYKIFLFLNLLFFFSSVVISIRLKPNFTIGNAYNIILEDPNLRTQFSSYNVDTTSTYARLDGLIRRQYIFWAVSDDQEQQITIAFDPITGEYVVISGMR